MITDWSGIRIFIKPGMTDMRKQINGLSILVEEEVGQDLFSGNLFLFCNRNRNRLKVLYWERNGFCMWLKRLEQDKFPWPMKEEEVREIARDQLVLLLDGIDFFHAHKKLHFSSTI
jgi:transposase